MSLTNTYEWQRLLTYVGSLEAINEAMQKRGVKGESRTENLSIREACWETPLRREAVIGTDDDAILAWAELIAGTPGHVNRELALEVIRRLNHG